MGKIEVMEVKTIDGKPFVVVSPTSSGTFVYTKSKTLETNRVPLSEIPIGSVFAVEYTGRTKHYRVIGIGDKVIFVEKITKKEAETLSDKISVDLDAIIKNIANSLEGHSKRADSKMKLIISTKEELIRKLKELERLNREIDELHKLVSKKYDTFNPKKIVDVMKMIAKEYGESNGSNTRWELYISDYIKINDMRMKATVYMVLDNNKDMFYIKGGVGEPSYYLYFEKGQERKFSRDVGKWVEVLDFVGGFIKKQSTKNFEEVLKQAEELAKMSAGEMKDLEKFKKGATKLLAEALKPVAVNGKVEVFISDVERKIETIEKLIEKMGRKPPKEFYKFKRDFMDFAIRNKIRKFIIAYNERGNLKYIYVDSRYFNEIPLSFAEHVVKLAYFYLKTELILAKEIENFVNSMMKDMEKMIESLVKKRERLIAELTNIVKNIAENFPKKKTSYGYSIELGKITIGYNPKRNKVLFIREGRHEYIYSDDAPTIDAISTGIFAIRKELEKLSKK